MPGPSFTSIQALIDDIAAGCRVPQSSFTAVGSVEAGKRMGPPRVVWVPISSKVEPAVQDEDDESKVCAQRVIRFEVEITATDFDHYLDLADDLTISAFNSQSPWSMRVLEEDYSRTGIVDNSRFQGVLTVEVDIPIRHVEYTSETVLNTSQTGIVTD